MGSHTLPLPAPHVEETRFGKWFLRTQTWRVHVLERAMTDLVRLTPGRHPAYGVVIDVGCGSGYSLPRLAQRFLPRELIGVDIDPEMLAVARRELERADVDARLIQSSSTQMPLPDGYADLLFCHQTFHHLVEQEAALAEFMRVLKPGGILLFTTRGRYWEWKLSPQERERYDAGEAVVRYSGVAGTNLCATFHPWSYVHDRLGADFTVLQSFPSRLPDGAQDVHVLERPAKT